MALADDLLDVATHLATQNGKPEAFYRRSVSSSYYAAFHSICDATAQLVVHQETAWHIARKISHQDVTSIAQAWTPSKKKQGKKPSVKPFELYGLNHVANADVLFIAENIVELRARRETADYDQRESIGQFAANETLSIANDLVNLVDVLLRRSDADLTAFLRGAVFGPVRKP